MSLRLFTIVLFCLPTLVFGAEKCFVLSFEEGKPSLPAERICIGDTKADTKETQLRLLWGDKQIAIFNYLDISLDAQLPGHMTSRIFAASSYFTPAINAFSISMRGKIDPATGIEKGTIQIGNQMMGRQNLYYITE